VYTSSDYFNVSKIDTSTGNVSWTYEQDTSTYSEVDIGLVRESETRVITGDTSRLWAINKSTGAREWVDADAMLPAHVGNSIVLFRGAGVVAVDAASGDRLWNNSDVDGNLYEAVIAGDSIYVSNTYGSIVSLDKGSGSVEWSVGGVDNKYRLANHEFDGVLFASARPGSELIAVDVGNGDVLWNYSTGGYVVSAATEDGDWLFVSSTDSSNVTASVYGFDTPSLSFDGVSSGDGTDDGVSSGDGTDDGVVGVGNESGSGGIVLVIVALLGGAAYVRFYD